MHEQLARASHERREWQRGAAAVIAAAMMVIASLPAAFPARASGTSASSPQPAALEIVPPGGEGLELTARLSEDGGIVNSGLTWTVTQADGRTVYAGDSGTVDISVPPGDYHIDLRFGSARLERNISLPEASRLLTGFVLGAGALSVTPRTGVDDVPALPYRIRVFALGGDTHGRLIAATDTPEDVLRLTSGRYRLESRIGIGNAVAVTDVNVNAGRLTKVSIGHKAGLARLAFVGSPAARVVWTVTDATGTVVAASEGLNAQAYLKPGRYVATAATGPEDLTARFTIADGQTRDIMLGN